MKLHELRIKYRELIDITIGIKTFVIYKNDNDFQVGDLIRFDNVWLRYASPKAESDFEPYIDKDTLYRITYISPHYDIGGWIVDSDDTPILKDGYCILGIKRLELMGVK